MKKFAVVAAMFLLAVSAFAADLNGKWVAQISNPNGGDSERVFTLSVTAGKLTGTIINKSVAPASFEQPGKKEMTGILKTQQGKPVEIIEGQVTGDKVSFAAMGNMFGTQVKTVYTGTFAGDELKVTAEAKIPDGLKSPSGSPVTAPKPQDLVAKRVK